MGHTTVYTLPWPELSYPAKGPDGYKDLALATEAALLQEKNTADSKPYTPTWRSAGSLQPSGMGWTARYNVRNGVCTMHAFGQMTDQTGGGTGWFLIGLPVRARSNIPEQMLATKLWLATIGWNFAGWAYIPGGSIEAIPYFPISPWTSSMAGWASADNSGQPGTGFPQINGQHPVQNGNFNMWGRYYV
jgi:hypothetical protein